MARQQSTYMVGLAIENCLARCRNSEAPLACLAEALDELRDRLWREAHVREVERAVLKVLMRVLVTRFTEPYESV